MINTNILIGVIVGVFLAGMGGAYAIFVNAETTADQMNQNSDLMKQMVDEMTRHHKSMESMMGSNMESMMGSNMDSTESENQPMGSMMEGTDMMSGMMSQIPEDVIVKVTSRQTVPTGKEAEITLLVLDKETEKPLTDADVIIGIERGSSMSTMDMTSSMFEAENIGSGKYIVRFTPDSSGIYTMHTHVIPAGKSMMSMMNNHMDIGIIVK